MPTLSPYLQRRGYSLNFRIAVPHDLRALVGARELTRALPTNDRRAAALLALRCALIARQAFAELRACYVEEMDEDKLRELMREKRWQIRLDKVEEEHSLEMQEARRRHRREIEHVRLEAENAALRNLLRSVVAAPQAGRTANPTGGSAAASVMQAVNVSEEIPAPTEGMSAVANAIQLPTLADAGRAGDAFKALTFGHAVKTFLDTYPTQKKGMLAKHRLVLPLMLQIVGDKPLAAMKQADVNRFFKTVLRLPPHWRSDCRKRGIAASTLASESHEETIAPKTFRDTYKASVRMFLKQARLDWQDEGFPTTLTTDGIEYSGDRKKGEKKQRAFRDDELQRLFHGPELAAFRNDPALEHQFWLAYVGLYTGARVNEICQINPQVDVRQEGETGIWHFALTEESDADERIDKSIKNDPSVRTVPIHSHLIELGFLDYVERVRSSGAKLLFPAFVPERGRASPKGEKWFREFMLQLGLRDETPGARLVGMHAFRSTMLAKARIAKPPVDVTPITGHAAPAGPVVGGYQGGLPLTNKQEALEAVPFGIRPAV